MRMNNLTTYVMATLVAAFTLSAAPAFAQTATTEDADPYQGLILGLTMSHQGILPPNLTRANLLSGVAGLSYRFDPPVSVDVSGGIISVLKGGVASHYTEDTDGHTAGHMSIGLSFLPPLSEHVALLIRPKGTFIFNGGGGGSLDVGSVFYIGEDKSFQLELGSTVGWLDWDNPMGDNPTYPRLEDPTLRGILLGTFFGMRYKVL